MLQSLVTRLLANKHTSIAAVIVIGVAIIVKIGPIWLPAHAQQFKDTGDALEKLALGYGLLMAGDSKPQIPDPPKP